MLLRQLLSQRWRVDLWQKSSSSLLDLGHQDSPVRSCAELGNIEATKWQTSWYLYLKRRGLGQGRRSTGAFPEFLVHFVPSPMEGKKMEIAKCAFLKDVTVLKTQLHTCIIC